MPGPREARSGTLTSASAPPWTRQGGEGASLKPKRCPEKAGPPRVICPRASRAGEVHPQRGAWGEDPGSTGHSLGPWRGEGLGPGSLGQAAACRARTPGADSPPEPRHRPQLAVPARPLLTRTPGTSHCIRAALPLPPAPVPGLQGHWARLFGFSGGNRDASSSLETGLVGPKQGEMTWEDYKAALFLRSHPLMKCPGYGELDGWVEDHLLYMGASPQGRSRGGVGGGRRGPPSSPGQTLAHPPVFLGSPGS